MSFSYNRLPGWPTHVGSYTVFPSVLKIRGLNVFQVFKFLSRSYASTHESMYTGNARCGTAYSQSHRGTVNGAQWASNAGGETLPGVTTRGCQMTKVHLLSLSGGFFSCLVVQACKISTTSTPTASRWPWSWGATNFHLTRICFSAGMKTRRQCCRLSKQ